ncbi:MAG: HAD-IB family phosphatase [Eubacteriales bacterium]|nr:HAD-IB family phosphatase [Eubacteriales bacterium]MDD3349733.1 HAD-IB family phosphatase [Eubacteriales bacterium]
MEHNVYDFDKTIYKGDSTADFYFFCFKKHPAIIRELPILIMYATVYLFGRCSKTRFKEKFFRFLRHVECVDDLLLLFWKLNRAKIAGYYYEVHREGDIVISASPEFLLAPICKSLGIENLIASKVDKRTGLYDGENCRAEEKARRLKEELPEATIHEFYSDSLSDAPLARMAEKAYLVRKEERVDWPDQKKSYLEKTRNTYLSKEFFLFVFCGGMGTLTNFVFSLIISNKVDATLSYVFGYAISLFVAYALNAKLLYKEKLRSKVFVKFVVSYIPNFMILFSFVVVFLNLLHWEKIIVYALAGLLGLPITYITVKIFAFGKRED